MDLDHLLQREQDVWSRTHNLKGTRFEELPVGEHQMRHAVIRQELHMDFIRHVCLHLADQRSVFDERCRGPRVLQSINSPQFLPGTEKFPGCVVVSHVEERYNTHNRDTFNLKLGLGRPPNFCEANVSVELSPPRPSRRNKHKDHMYEQVRFRLGLSMSTDYLERNDLPQDIFERNDLPQDTLQRNHLPQDLRANRKHFATGDILVQTAVENTLQRDIFITRPWSYIHQLLPSGASSNTPDASSNGSGSSATLGASSTTESSPAEMAAATALTELARSQELAAVMAKRDEHMRLARGFEAQAAVMRGEDPSSETPQTGLVPSFQDFDAAVSMLLSHVAPLSENNQELQGHIRTLETRQENLRIVTLQSQGGHDELLKAHQELNDKLNSSEEKAVQEEQKRAAAEEEWARKEKEYEEMKQVYVEMTQSQDTIIKDLTREKENLLTKVERLKEKINNQASVIRSLDTIQINHNEELEKLRAEKKDEKEAKMALQEQVKVLQEQVRGLEERIAVSLDLKKS
ncbi:hypothetical protein QBC41DRAFT_35821 [Cercophora samala]|uniref:Uncharacterized protein n=1 Tax=Cercophora samala TaxID=330535 RepID=A0AA39Z0J3_9PEZI|nr:hypothetical protein QBC41DRAFT_35821 [Cercophora samala]